MFFSTQYNLFTKIICIFAQKMNTKLNHYFLDINKTNFN